MLVSGHEEPEYICCAGTPLVGTCTSRGFCNGAFYEVLAVSKDCVKVRDSLTQQVLEVTSETLGRHTAVAWAVVYHRAQGLTIRDKVVALHDLESKFLTRAHVFVGLSRVTAGTDIRVA